MTDATHPSYLLDVEREQRRWPLRDRWVVWVYEAETWPAKLLNDFHGVNRAETIADAKDWCSKDRRLRKVPESTRIAYDPDVSAALTDTTPGEAGHPNCLPHHPV